MMNLSLSPSNSVQQRQTLQQRQTVLPRQMQFARICKMPFLELMSVIYLELESNPVLCEEAEAPYEIDEPPALKKDKAKRESEPWYTAESTDTGEWNLEELSDTRARPSRSQIEEAREREGDRISSQPSEIPQRLDVYWRRQLEGFNLPKALLAMALRIIRKLDHRGVLEEKGKEVLGENPSPERVALFETALGHVQRLDPPGIGARDRRECLLLQITPAMPSAHVMRTLITDHWNDIPECDDQFPQLASCTGFPLPIIESAMAELRGLKLNPLDAFSNMPAHHIIPEDIFVDKNDAGDYVVEVRGLRPASLCLNPYYERMLEKQNLDDECRTFLDEKMRTAQNYISDVNNRRETLRLVVQAIVDYQWQALDYGLKALKPLTMTQIANRVGRDPSLVSRLVAGKSIVTSCGAIPLESFFVSGTVTTEGDAISWTAVQDEIRALIENERRRHPLTDDQLADALREKGFQVDRRRVAEQRNAAGIPSSRGRRRA